MKVFLNTCTLYDKHLSQISATKYRKSPLNDGHMIPLMLSGNSMLIMDQPRGNDWLTYFENFTNKKFNFFRSSACGLDIDERLFRNIRKFAKYIIENEIKEEIELIPSTLTSYTSCIARELKRLTGRNIVYPKFPHTSYRYYSRKDSTKNIVGKNIASSHLCAKPTEGSPFVIKPLNSSGGDGIVLYGPNDCIDAKYLNSDLYCIEKYYSDVICSPSTHGLTTGKRQIVFQSLEDFSYIGCQNYNSLIPADVIDELVEIDRSVTMGFKKLGYHYWLGNDYIIIEENSKQTIKFIESNLRLTTSYPALYLSNFLCKKLGHFMHMTYFLCRSPKLCSLDDILSLLSGYVIVPSSIHEVDPNKINAIVLSGFNINEGRFSVLLIGGNYEDHSCVKSTIERMMS